jgi:hypothetical protein
MALTIPSRPEKAAFVLMLVGFAIAAHAADKCATPPFGDTPQNYADTQAALKRSAGSATDLSILRRTWRDALIESCQAKFEYGDRSEFYRYDIGQGPIESLPVTTLANMLLQGRPQAIDRRQAAEREDPNTIWVIFQCTPAPGTCRPAIIPTVPLGDHRAGDSTFPSLAKCRGFMRYAMPGYQFDERTGHAKLGNYSVWLECFSHHVDNWQRAP